MTASQKDLIDLFADGEMPTGAHFSALITSMTPRSEFDAHTAAFDEWAAAGTAHLGPTGAGWSLISPDAQTLSVVPDEPDPTPRENARIDLYGWTSSFGRIGTGKNRARFTGEPMLDRSALAEVPCGKPQVILDPPSGMAAFEIVAATEYYDVAQHGVFTRIFRRVIGLQSDTPDICHAIATACVPGVEPQVKRTNPSRLTQMLWHSFYEGLLVALVILPLFLVLLSGLGVSSSNSEFLFQVFLFLGSLWVLRRAFQLLAVRNRCIRLSWEKSKSVTDVGIKRHELQIRGPKPASQPGAKLHYHITTLWG